MQHYYIQQLVSIYYNYYYYCTYFINSLLIPLGASDDWAKGVAKIKYSYTVELRDTGKYGFILPPSEILSTGKEAYIAVSTLVSEISSENNNEN